MPFMEKSSMRTIWTPLIALLFVVPAQAVVVTCVNEGGNVVRIDYSASDETILPVAFALDITVDGGAVIQSIYGYKVGDSTASSRGFGIFPSSIQFDDRGVVGNWGTPDMSKPGSANVQAGVGTSGVTIGLASRYNGPDNAPLVQGTLCRIRVDPRGAATVNVKVARNAFGGGVVLENATPAKFTGVGCVLGVASTTPSIPQPPTSITYPSTSSTGQYAVTWPPSTGATSYRLERSANDGSTWAAAYSGAAPSYAETVSSGSYRYRVRATNSAGPSDWTAGSTACIVSTSTAPSELQPPASITYPSTSSTGQYTVSWPASSGATSYRLQRRSSRGHSWTTIYSGADLSCAQAVRNGTYRYRVKAVNSEGSSTWTTGSATCTVSMTSSSSVPQPPASITYPATSDTGQYTVSWPAAAGATSYRLQRISSHGSWTTIYSGADLSYAQTVHDGTYRYRVKAVNSEGGSGWMTGLEKCIVSMPSPPHEEE
jgi:uncharacterized protein YegP (UPF0339 family)